MNVIIVVLIKLFTLIVENIVEKVWITSNLSTLIVFLFWIIQHRLIIVSVFNSLSQMFSTVIVMPNLSTPCYPPLSIIVDNCIITSFTTF